MLDCTQTVVATPLQDLLSTLERSSGRKPKAGGSSSQQVTCVESDLLCHNDVEQAGFWFRRQRTRAMSETHKRSSREYPHRCCAAAGYSMTIARVKLLRLPPCAFILLFLLMSVLFYGFGSKLARYSLHPDAESRAISVKLWDKHQQIEQIARSAVSASRLELVLALSSSVLALLSMFAPARLFSEVNRAAAISIPYRSAIPLRSPPTKILAA